MKMTFFPYELKLRHVFTVATYSRTTTPDVQVEIEYEGVTGYGEASMPPYLGETVESVMNFLKKVNLEQFSDPFQLEDILSYVDSLSPKTRQQKLRWILPFMTWWESCWERLGIRYGD